MRYQRFIILALILVAIAYSFLSQNLSFGLAKQIDHYNNSRKLAGQPLPHDSFDKHLFRQPTLTEPLQYPEPYRKEGEYGFLDENTRAVANPLKILFDDVHKSNEERQWERETAARLRRRHSSGGGSGSGTRLRSKSINVHAMTDESADTLEELEQYFHETVLPLSVIPITASPLSSLHGGGGTPRRRRSAGSDGGKGNSNNNSNNNNNTPSAMPVDGSNNV
jgi:hypothetical protein